MTKIKKHLLILMESCDVGGVETSTLEISKELKKMGYKIVLCSAGGRLEREFRNAGITTYCLPLRLNIRGKKAFTKSIINFLAFPITLMRLVKIIKKEDINILHVNPHFPILFGLIINRVWSIPYIISFHGVYSRPLKQKALYKNTTKIVAISYEIQDDLINRYHIPKEKIIIIPNGIKIPRNMSMLGKPANYSIVTVSRIDYKMLNVTKSMISAFMKIQSEIPNTKLYIVGDGNCFSDIKKSAEKINAVLRDEAINLVGFSSNPRAYMEKGDVVLGIGRVAMEAMSLGKPVIIAGSKKGNRGGSFGGIITEGNLEEHMSYNFSGRNSKIPISPDVIADACIDILKDDAKRLSYGTLCRKIAEKHLDIHKIGKNYDKLYSTVTEDLHEKIDDL